MIRGRGLQSSIWVVLIGLLLISCGRKAPPARPDNATYPRQYPANPYNPPKPVPLPSAKLGQQEYEEMQKNNQLKDPNLVPVPPHNDEDIIDTP